jgi:hypothetical protein
LFNAIVLIGPASEFGIYDTWQIGMPFVVAVLAGGVCITYGAIRSGILVEPGRMTNRRMLTTNRVSSRDIARFEPPPAYGAIRRTGIRIVLFDGRVLSATAFTKGKMDNDSVGVAECAELNAWLENQNHGHVATPLY